VKAIYSTLMVTYARVTYAAEVRITPPKPAPHVGPDHPKYMSPGAPLQVRVLRILRDRVDVSDDLLWHTRDGIQELVELEVAAKYGRKKGASVRTAEVAVIPLKADERGQLRLIEDSR